ALIDAVDQRGRCCLAMSGGTSPFRMFEELAKMELPWEAVHLFQVDERATRDDSPDRNFTGLRDHLLAYAAIPSVNLHPMPVGMPSLDEAAARYTETLETFCGDPPELDVVHLGIGTDGHVASLFPGTPELDERERLVVSTGEHAGFRRLSLTFPVINAAHDLMMLVVGAEKAEALAAMVAGDDVPASRLDTARLHVFATDEAAASIG
ncbi:MAG TPA: 6-phosphogluconolactonase, partial [Acidimicrobiia bacterium]|nr:6-phosphogluconolactonase [Acidimicrobiia bacterium]